MKKKKEVAKEMLDAFRKALCEEGIIRERFDSHLYPFSDGFYRAVAEKMAERYLEDKDTKETPDKYLVRELSKVTEKEEIEEKIKKLKEEYKKEDITFSVEPLTPDKLDCCWYDGAVATFTYKDLLLTIYAYGDITMNYCDEDAVKEWSCGKRFGKRNDIGDYIKDDVVLHLLESTGYLTYWYNNWFEGICHIGKEEQEGFVCDDNDILKIVEAVKANTEWIRETYSDYVWGLHDARRKEQSL